MKIPGDTGHQGIAIDQLDTTPSIDLSDAIETAAALGSDPASYDPESDTAEIDPDFVINAIDFRPHDVFLWASVGRFEVLSTNQYHPGLSLIHPEAPHMEPANTETCDFAEAYAYSQLWRDWLRGDVVPLDRETRYIRQDTTDRVLVRDVYQTHLEPQVGDIAYAGIQRGLVTEVRTDGDDDVVVLEAEVDLNDEPLVVGEWTIPIPDLDRLERPTGG